MPPTTHSATHPVTHATTSHTTCRTAGQVPTRLSAAPVIP